MLQYIINKIGYGLFVMLGVVMLVFFLFQGIGDPTRLIVGQRADAATQQSIRRELNLAQPVWKQFLYYLNDVSPISLYSGEAVANKDLKGILIGGKTKLAIKLPYLR